MHLNRAKTDGYMGDYDMRKKMIVFSIIALMLFSIVPMHAMASASASTIVYIMPHGTKYHSKGCYHLADGYSAVTLGTAYRKGYEQCKNCHAPLLNYDDRMKIAEEMANSNSTEDNYSSALLMQSQNTHSENTYYELPSVTMIFLCIVICVLLSVYISRLKNTVHKKEQELTELKADLKIAQARIEMMKEFQNQSNHTKEENS